MADKLVIKRSYNAPIDVVWDAWADPSKAKAWWGPRGFTAPVVELDERPGGKWRAKMVGPDGFQQAAQAVAKNGMVVGEQNTHRLGLSVIHRQLPASAGR